jgi:HEAT repeat protein
MRTGRTLILIAASVVSAAGCTARPEPTMAHGHPVAHWVDATRDADPRVRKKAVDVLGNLGTSDPAVVHALAAALKDRDAAVRREAAQALLKLGPAAREAAPALREAAKDPDARVRAAAAQAVEKLGT